MYHTVNNDTCSSLSPFYLFLAVKYMGVPAQRSALHRMLPPLHVQPQSGREGGRTRHSTHAVSLEPLSRGTLGGESRQHSSAFTHCNNFSGGLRIGSHVLFIQIAFPHIQKSTLVFSLENLFSFLLFSTVLRCSHFRRVPSLRD